MNNIKFIAFALIMAISLTLVGDVEAKSNHKSHKNSHSNARSHSKSNKHAANSNKKVSQASQKNKNNVSQQKISPSALKHIKDRHWYNANQGTSQFNHRMTDEKLSKLAAKTINQGSQRASTHGQGRSTHQYRFNKPIGTTSSGQNAHSLRVVTDANNNVITAFPVK